MTLPLNDIALELKRMIFQKCSARSLCRLRRANKAIDEAVEEDRYLIYARSDDAPIILRFRIKWNKKNLTLRIESLQELLLWDFFFISKVQEIPEERFQHMTDPYKQLSGIYIDIVYFHADHYTHRYRIVHSTPSHVVQEIEGSSLDKQRILLHSEILPLFQRLRLRSERLSVVDLPSSLISDILCLLRGVSKIFLFTDIRSSDIVALPLENVEERFYYSFMDIPRSLTPLISGASYAFLQFYQKENLDIFKDFLEELRQEGTEIGNLKCLDFRFQGERERDLSKTQGIECIWQGTICDFPGLPDYYPIEASAYTMRTSEGAVIILSDKENYYLHFVAEANREVLFELVSSWIFTLGAYDLSGLYDEFMAIEDISEAFTTIYGRYFS